MQLCSVLRFAVLWLVAVSILSFSLRGLRQLLYAKDVTFQDIFWLSFGQTRALLAPAGLCTSILRPATSAKPMSVSWYQHLQDWADV